MGIAKEDGTLEAEEQIIDPDVPSLEKGELLVTVLLANISAHEKTQECADPLE